MIEHTSDLMKTLVGRGFLYRCTDEVGLDTVAGEGVTGYIGFDCTAPSLHVGSLVQIMMLRHLQKSGGRPIVLLGGGTTKIGDPSGKDKTRSILAQEKIEAYKTGMRQVFGKFLDFDGPNAAITVDNDEWLSEFGYIDFLRTVGAHFSVNRMVTMETARRRLENGQPLSFLEFNYPLLQSYDFVELNRRYNCRLQLGGSDQWGNITSGVDLTRRMEGNEVYGFTAPLVTTASGAKMGKTAHGAIWLNADLNQGEDYHRSPYDYWQFWRNTEDADVGRFLRLFTDLPLDEAAELETLEGADINTAKIRLANEATTLLHGKQASNEAEETARRIFKQGATATGLPTLEANIEGVLAIDAAILTGLAASRGEARRHIKGNALKINDERVTDDSQALSSDDVNDGVIKVSIGRKRHALIRPA
ncbi:MAG: tyrosine--tRNA ligase [Hyphomonadaceae bacterium]|nr:tyrosine--tRNA ligase [Hyphomonadaceae bacterium]